MGKWSTFLTLLLVCLKQCLSEREVRINTDFTSIELQIECEIFCLLGIATVIAGKMELMRDLMSTKICCLFLISLLVVPRNHLQQT